MYYLTV